MILGMTPFTFVHVLLSLAGIASGFVVCFGLLSHKWLGGWTAFYLATTVATSVTGFGFPFDRLLPSHVVGIISLVVLAVAICARYPFHLSGAWRTLYVVGAVMALYFNVFVLVVQVFRRVPFLKEAAPTQAEPPFAVTQLVVLALFIWLGTAAVLKSRGELAPNQQARIAA